MNILISNDDGFDSFGMTTLAKEISKNHNVIIFAPSENKSAASSSLTLTGSLEPIKVAKNIYKINGTPSDCVHIGLRGFFDNTEFDKFDLVITGTNFGANMGDDVVYSGTVAGAIEARFLGLPSVAFSLAVDIMTPHNHDKAENHNFETAAKVASQIVDNIDKINIARGTILNVNVPDVAFEKLAGMQTTRLGKRHMSSKIKLCDKKTGNYYLGENGLEDDNSLGTDFYAINNNFVSITPLHIDLTRYSEMEALSNFIEKL
jgi:5'-nucleotidase